MSLAAPVLDVLGAPLRGASSGRTLSGARRPDMGRCCCYTDVVEAAIIAIMSVLAAAVVGLAWRIPLTISKECQRLSDKMDAGYRELSDKIDTKVDGLSKELRAEIRDVRSEVRDVRSEVSKVRSELAEIGERVAHIEGRLVGDHLAKTA